MTARAFGSAANRQTRVAGAHGWHTPCDLRGVHASRRCLPSDQLPSGGSFSSSRFGGSFSLAPLTASVSTPCICCLRNRPSPLAFSGGAGSAEGCRLRRRSITVVVRMIATASSPLTGAPGDVGHELVVSSDEQANGRSRSQGEGDTEHSSDSRQSERSCPSVRLPSRDSTPPPAERQPLSASRGAILLPLVRLPSIELETAPPWGAVLISSAATVATMARMLGSMATKGQRISAAKKGKPLVARGPNEITRQEAVRETGLSAKVLLEGADRQVRHERGLTARRGLRHRRLPHANGGEVILYDRDELAEDLARLPCQWCDQPAPGDSGRCRRHQAKKYATVDLTCFQCGEPFTRHGSWLRERDGRGRFCSDECQFAWQRENDPRFGSQHALFDADSARERYERLAPQFDEARAQLALPLTVHQVAAATYTSIPVIRTHAADLGGKVIEIDGKQELGFPADAPDRYPRIWAGRAHVSDEHWSRHRKPYLDPDFMERQQRHRVLSLEQRKELRQRVAARAKLLTPKRAGAGRKDTLHEEWRRLFYALRRQLVGWSDLQVCASVAELDFRSHPEAWPKYAAADDGGLRPEDEGKAARRVWMAIR
jgi:hypothetical protein